MASSLSSTLAFGSEEDTDQVCQPCDKSGQKASPSGYCTTCNEYLCQDCFNSHKKDKSRIQHKLLRNDEILMSNRSTLFHSDAFDEITMTCKKHKEHVVNFYCNEHQALICDLCKNLDHASRTCSVLYIPNVSEETLDGQEYSETIKYLEAFMEGSEKGREKVKKMSEKSNASLEESVKSMKNFRRLLNEKLDDLEKAFTNEVRNISQKSFMKMRETETTYNNVIRTTSNLLEEVKQLNESKQGNKLFMELKQVRETMKTNSTLLEKVSTDAVTENYKFEVNKAIGQVVMQERSIGHLVNKVEDSNQNGKMCVKMSDEHNKCWITGMTLISPSVLILTDFLNKSVKMINLTDNLVTSKFTVNSPPYNVAKVSIAEVAVSMPEDGQIMLTTVLSNKLVPNSRLKVEGKFCRIGYCSGRGYAVVYDDPAKLAILDKKGKQLLTVAKDTKGRDVFAGPDDVTTCFDYIVISDRVRKAVIRVSWKGEVTGIYSEDLKGPQGLALSKDGTVFVCDNGSNSLLRISADFKKSEALITSIKRPCAVCYCDKTKHLYQSTATQNKAYDNYIHIFSSTK